MDRHEQFLLLLSYLPWPPTLPKALRHTKDEKKGERIRKDCLGYVIVIIVDVVVVVVVVVVNSADIMRP